MRVVSESAEQTRALGAALAGLLRPGDLVILAGDLGAGKTVLVQGAAAALGVTQRVTSPTFILARTYAGDVPVSHVDAYRVGTLGEFEDLDLDLAGSVTFVEWGDAVLDALPDEHLLISIVRGQDDVREIEVEPHGAAWVSRNIEGALR